MKKKNKQCYDRSGGIRMIATIEKVHILDKAEEMVQMITESDVYERYVYTKQQIKNDETIQQMIKEFVKMKDVYAEVQRFGKYHPDYEKVTTEIRQLKRKMDLHETIAVFKKTEDELNTLLVSVAGIVAGSVSTNIKVPTGNPYFDQLPSCGCGSGGGCGCKTKK